MKEVCGKLRTSGSARLYLTDVGSWRSRTTHNYAPKIAVSNIAAILDLLCCSLSKTCCMQTIDRYARFTTVRANQPLPPYQVQYSLGFFKHNHGNEWALDRVRLYTLQGRDAGVLEQEGRGILSHERDRFPWPVFMPRAADSYSKRYPDPFSRLA